MEYRAAPPPPFGLAPLLTWKFCIIFALFVILHAGEDGTGITAAAPCLSSQRLALLQFKRSLSRGSQTLLDSWQNESDCCMWKGVSCDNTTGFVTELNIYNLGVQVSEPDDSLFELRQLRYLELGRNLIGGVIPSRLTDLTELTNLGLSYCNFTGTIPEFFKQLSNLTLLDLSGNDLRGQIPPCLLNHPTLQTLYLGFNNLNGSLPEVGNGDSALKKVYFSPNMLHGEIPASICNLLHLELLEGTGNKFTGILHLSLFQDMKNLSYLSLSSNELTVRLPELVDRVHQTEIFSRLEILQLSACNIEGEFPWFLQNAKGLEVLDLSNNNISRKLPAWVWGLPNLQVLFLPNNVIQGFEEAVNISVSINLAFLNLNENQLRGRIPRGLICGLSHLERVELNNNQLTDKLTRLLHNCSSRIKQVLDLSHNRLKGSLPDNWLTSFYQLEVLDLSNNQLHGPIPDKIEISSNAPLNVLNLNDNNLVGRLPRSLSNYSQLQVVNFAKNELSDVFPFWLGHLNHLHVLVLHSNRFYGSILSPFSEHIFPSLQILDISRNQLTGSLPPKLCQSFYSMMRKKPKIDQEYESLLPYEEDITLTIKGQTGIQEIMAILTCIDFSNNLFAGKIPEEIGLLEGLYSLNLSWNYLDGPIPKSLGHLQEMESLDLSHNHLSGSIPEELTRDTFLSVLDLSYNDLQGRIPQDNQLATFNATSFDGNPRLCGPPPPRSCPSSKNGSQESIDPVEEKAPHPCWEYVATGSVGFTVGLLTMALPTLFIRRVEIWYWDRVDRALEALMFLLNH
ncbi:Receptor-like protein 12 [Nymphaea thermarum]|nr:Receptor-like protein 12 [Nymphaea thermarum]